VVIVWGSKSHARASCAACSNERGLSEEDVTADKVGLLVTIWSNLNKMHSGAVRNPMEWAQFRNNNFGSAGC